MIQKQPNIRQLLLLLMLPHNAYTFDFRAYVRAHVCVCVNIRFHYSDRENISNHFEFHEQKYDFMGKNFNLFIAFAVIH